MNRRVAEWLLILAGFTVIAAVFAVSSSLTFMLTYQPPRWSSTFGSALADWYPWAALTPLVMWLGRRFRLRRTSWIMRLAGLALAGFVVAFIKLTVTRILRQTSGVAGYIAITNFATQYFIFWGVIAATHAVEHYREGRERELRASQLETSLAEARLQLLKMQLQPHFLFNTLNTVAELVHENADDAERMITGLGVLLRETLDAGLTDLLPLERELALVDRYVGIQQVRFGDRLSVTVNADDAVRQALVPGLVLQPLVENAIKHSVAARREGGCIVVRAFRRDASLVLEVHDDGVGFDSQAMRAGVGIANTRARLTELFGSAHAFDVESSPERGTLVRLVFPFRT